MPRNLNLPRPHASLLLSLALAALCLTRSPWVHSQTASGTESPSPTVASSFKSGRATQTRPSRTRLWTDLSPAQQQALAPLSSHWTGLSQRQQRAWIRLSLRYGRMTPQQQARLQERMTHWAALSPDQRDKARLRFADAQRSGAAITPEQWRAYQALSPESKRQLRQSARSLPPRTALRAQATPARALKHMTWRPHRARSTQPSHARPQRLSHGARRAAPRSRGH